MAKEFVLFESDNTSDNTEQYLEYSILMSELGGLTTTNEIICIAKLGLWNGVKSAYKIFSRNVKDVLYINSDALYIKIWIDSRGNVRSKQIHHDGTNYYLFRELRNAKDSRSTYNLLDKIYNDKLTSADITKYTRPLKNYLSEIYNI